jgi:glycosyltransferase involved in cell wall biosynthesis
VTKRRLRVAIDARSLQDRPINGVGRAVGGSLVGLRDEVEFVLLTDERKAPIETDLEQRALRAPGSATMAAWLQLAVPPALRGFEGVFHCPWYGLPLRQPVPMVVSLHDMSFELYPQWFSKSRLWTFRLQARWAARTAAAVITHAEAIRQEVLARYRVDAERVTVAPEFVEAGRVGVAPEAQAAAVARLGLTGPYVVAIGGAERRNLAAVLEAWPTIRARHPGHSLVVMGEPGAEDRGLAGVVVVGRLEDADWIGCLAGAQLLVYPTFYEGFGQPAAEAITNGVPVVCARRGSLPEVVGSAGHWLEDLEPASVAVAVGDLLGDDEALRLLRAATTVEARRLTDPGFLAAGTLQAYELAERERRA